jgi:tRNA-splicing ligase RtcB (3'-phosphate/5'-hydroxy nucleic acid ligase)
MRTEGVIYSDSELFALSAKDGCPVQVANVAHLPGIVGPALAMPDIHLGYGFPIGGVAAFDADEGVVSPGGVGYDINCGVRLLTSSLDREDVRGLEEGLIDALFKAVPAGVGSRRTDLGIGGNLFEACMVSGASAATEAGFGERSDVDRIEGGGKLAGADPGKVSPRAFKRGAVQLGTLGSGNHFVEVGCVDEIYNEAAAAAFGLVTGRVTVMIHTGSRGFGHQICDDALRELKNSPAFRKLDLPDRQLCCAPIRSPAGEAYLAAMAAAANFAFANRQIITHTVREAFSRALRGGGRDRSLDLLYDLAHNIAKFEDHEFEGRRRRLLVHRKGATRAFPPGHPELTAPAFLEHGQPVILPGDMGRYSYVLAGRREGGVRTFFSSAHGAGRVMSRKQAKTAVTAGQVLKDLKERGITLRAASKGTIVEENPRAYKDVAAVARVLRKAGIADPVARIRPFLVVKG